MITQYAFNGGITINEENNANNINENPPSIQLMLDGVMAGDIQAILNQTERLKKIKSKQWGNVKREVLLSIRDKRNPMR